MYETGTRLEEVLNLQNTDSDIPRVQFSFCVERESKGEWNKK